MAVFFFGLPSSSAQSFERQSWTHLLKGVEATGFAQTNQIFQDGLLKVLCKKWAWHNCSQHPVTVCRRSSCAASTYRVVAELLVGTQQASFPGPVGHHLRVRNHDPHQTGLEEQKPRQRGCGGDDYRDEEGDDDNDGDDDKCDNIDDGDDDDMNDFSETGNDETKTKIVMKTMISR